MKRSVESCGTIRQTLKSELHATATIRHHSIIQQDFVAFLGKNVEVKEKNNVKQKQTSTHQLT